MVARAMYTDPPRKGAEVYAPGPGASSAGDRLERGGREARAADQEPVHPPPGEKVPGVAGRDRAPVDDPELPAGRKETGDVYAGRGRVLRSGRAACPDGPDRLVRHDQRQSVGILLEGVDLANERGGGQARVALLGGLADAVDRGQPRLAAA